MNTQQINSFDTRITQLEQTSKETLSIVKQLRTAICGDEDYDIEGIAKTVRRHENYIIQDKKTKWMIAGAVAVITFLAGILTQLFDKIIKP